ncbi:hypothetical protein LXL04_031623 [Taraxacum kok-saghyz]
MRSDTLSQPSPIPLVAGRLFPRAAVVFSIACSHLLHRATAIFSIAPVSSTIVASGSSRSQIKDHLPPN